MKDPSKVDPDLHSAELRDLVRQSDDPQGLLVVLSLSDNKSARQVAAKDSRTHSALLEVLALSGDLEIVVNVVRNPSLQSDILDKVARKALKERGAVPQAILERILARDDILPKTLDHVWAEKRAFGEIIAQNKNASPHLMVQMRQHYGSLTWRATGEDMSQFIATRRHYPEECFRSEKATFVRRALRGRYHAHQRWETIQSLSIGWSGTVRDLLEAAELTER